MLLVCSTRNWKAQTPKRTSGTICSATHYFTNNKHNKLQQAHQWYDCRFAATQYFAYYAQLPVLHKINHSFAMREPKNGPITREGKKKNGPKSHPIDDAKLTRISSDPRRSMATHASATGANSRGRGGGGGGCGCREPAEVVASPCRGAGPC